jgi:hypothetical protein
LRCSVPQPLLGLLDLGVSRDFSGEISPCCVAHALRDMYTVRLLVVDINSHPRDVEISRTGCVRG